MPRMPIEMLEKNIRKYIRKNVRKEYWKECQKKLLEKIIKRDVRGYIRKRYLKIYYNMISEDTPEEMLINKLNYILEKDIRKYGAEMPIQISKNKSEKYSIILEKNIRGYIRKNINRNIR